MQELINYFGIKNLIPHGYCLSWSPALLWLHVVSDLLITLSYYSIPLMLVYFIRQRKDYPYSWMATMFAGFIVACGTTHLLSVITIWIPLYWVDGFIKALTAIISVATASLMIWVIPRALALPSAAQLRAEIQQRQDAEEALRKSEYKLTTILDSVEAFIYIKDCNFEYQYANKQVRQLFGKSQEEIIGKSDDAFFDEATSAKLRENDRRVIELGERSAIEEINISKDDATRAYLSIKQPLRSEDGTIYGLCGISTDITERKQMEEKLRDSNAFKVSVLNSLTSHLAVLDVQGMIVAVNNAWLKFAEENGITDRRKVMLGVNYLDACKNAFHKPYGEESHAAYFGILAVLRGEKETFSLEYPCHSPDQQRWFLLNVSPLQGSNRGAVVNHVNITERKEAEKVMTQIKAMIDISLDGFWIVDSRGKLLQVNDAYVKISGYSADELLTMSITDLEAAEDQEQVRLHIEKVIAQGYDLFETRHRHKDGHSIELEISVCFLSEFQHFCAFCRDISQRKVMENELRVSEAKFRSIIEVSPVPMVLLDGQLLNVIFLNPAFVQTFGYTLGDISTVADWRMKAYPDPDYRHWVEMTGQMALKNAIQEQTAFAPFEITIHCKNNNIRTVLVDIARIDHSFDDMYLVVLYDITQRKQVEVKLNAIFDAAVESIITVDSSDIILAANAAVEIVFGYKPEELIGCSISKLWPPSARETHDDNLTLAVKLPGKIRELEGIHKNGSLVPLDLSVAEYSIDGIQYFTYIVRDVTARKRREQQNKARLDELAHVTRLGLMGEMASGIAHEVNQPLCAISNYTEVCINLLTSENPDLVKLQEILQKTKQQALRAGQIIHRMREFVKAQSKHRSTADINTLIKDAVDLCSVTLKNNAIKLTFHLENNLPPVYVDHIQIEQVIINLIRNSVEALQNIPANQQRHLSIRSRLNIDNDIQVGVKDNGVGLDDEQKKQIWTPFYTTKSDGMGMGLSISRSLIEAHDGTLNFNSEPGKGSSFYFTLPSTI